MARRAMAVVILSALLGGCGIGAPESETTKRYKTMVKACMTIKDEHDRSECLQHVPPKP